MIASNCDGINGWIGPNEDNKECDGLGVTMQPYRAIVRWKIQKYRWQCHAAPLCGEKYSWEIQKYSWQCHAALAAIVKNCVVFRPLVFSKSLCWGMILDVCRGDLLSNTHVLNIGIPLGHLNRPSNSLSRSIYYFNLGNTVEMIVLQWWCNVLKRPIKTFFVELDQRKKQWRGANRPPSDRKIILILIFTSWHLKNFITSFCRRLFLR